MPLLTSLFDVNFNLHSRLLPSRTPGMVVQDLPHLSYVDSGLSCDTFNVLHMRDGESLTENELHEAVQYYEKRNLAFTMWIEESQRTRTVTELLLRDGFTLAAQAPGMLLEMSTCSVGNTTGSHDIRRVISRESLEHFAAVLAQNWQPADLNVIAYYQRVSEAVLSGADNVTLWLYYDNEVPVATLELFPSDAQTMGIYNLTTLTTHRRRGIGTALMEHGIQWSKKHDYQQVVLQASAAGLPIYQRLGFTTLTHYYEYQLTTPLGLMLS